MKLDGERESDNVEDNRGGGGGGGRMVGGRGIGLGTIAIALVGGWIFGINPLTILGVLGGVGDNSAPVVQQQSARPTPAQDDPQVHFVSKVLASTEDVWRAQFQAMGTAYREPKLRLYRGREATACGTGQAAMGPFYCPGDEKVYIDLSFYETMRTKLGAPGDFAQAYVIAHEIGHHVQRLLGITEKVESQRQRLSQRQNNELSVRLELQADFLAGVWAHHAEKQFRILEEGDVAEALNAASKIGDDHLQLEATGRVRPDAFTHGTSEQRMRWFRRGLETGDMRKGDTFAAETL